MINWRVHLRCCCDICQESEGTDDNKNTFGWDTDQIGSECHLLPHFNPNTNANADLIEYEYKTDSSNPDSNPDTFSI